jgi:hypothetical protein
MYLCTYVVWNVFLSLSSQLGVKTWLTRGPNDTKYFCCNYFVKKIDTCLSMPLFCHCTFFGGSQVCLRWTKLADIFFSFPFCFCRQKLCTYRYVDGIAQTLFNVFINLLNIFVNCARIDFWIKSIENHMSIW